MKYFYVLIFLLLSTVGVTQCDVYITPGSSIVYDHNPGISFGFEIQNDSDVPYVGGTLGVNFLLCNDDLWDFGFNGFGIILPGESKFIGTPIFDIPLPENAQDWYCYDDPDNPDNYFPWYLYLDGQEQVNGEYCWDAVTDPTQPNGYFNNPLSEGCDNPDGGIFCNDGCNIEIVDFDLETGELTITPYSAYCPNNDSPIFENQYPFNNPYIFGFTLNFNWGLGQIDIQVGGQQIHQSDDSIIIDLSNGPLNNPIYNNMIEDIENGEICDLDVTIYNANNTGQGIWEVSDNQTIEISDLCSVLENVDLSLDTVLYDVGCEYSPPLWDEGIPYWVPELYLTNEGDTPITEWCVNFSVLGQSNDTVCFNNTTILPGETYVQGWPNVYDWGVLSIHILHVNGVSENFWEDFGEDNSIANNMYVQIVSNEGFCEPEEIFGCTIEQACNYNPEATISDDSCEFESCAGCMDPEASNYDPEATIDTPGECEYDILGCTDETAFNYNPYATVDDGSCVPVIVGCMIPTALNYNPDANTTCVPIEECCTFPIEGCTDPEATNYNSEANVDDGSCKYDDICNGVFAPNTFTPNNDGVNDIWTLVTDPSCWLDWHIIIYNRWGQMVWESTIPGEVWMGSHSKGNHYVADGIYIYTARGVGYNPLDSFQKSGHITIFR